MTSYTHLNSNPPSISSLIPAYIRSIPRIIQTSIIVILLTIIGIISLRGYLFTCHACRANGDVLNWTQEADVEGGRYPTWMEIRDTWEGETTLTPDLPPTSPPTPTPTPPPFTASIIYLTSVSRIFQMAASIESIARHIPLSQSYPIILLHEGDFDNPTLQSAFLERWNDRIGKLELNGESEVARKMKEMERMIEFVDVDLKPPAEVEVVGKEKLDPVFDYAWPGYHSMCRFFATAVFDHPRLRNLDYYMRMDTDSFITSPIPIDPFITMHTRSKVYGYRNRGTDPIEVTHGMWDFLNNYLSENPSLANRAKTNQLTREKYGDRFPMMNNNFEVVHIPSFKSVEVRDWLLHVRAQTMGFYKYRWGDAPIRAATIDMFFHADQLIELCDFSYFHHDNVPKSCDLPPVL